VIGSASSCDVAHASEDTTKQAVKGRDEAIAAVAHGCAGIAGDGADAAQGPRQVGP
jgi:hypothetical protein